MKHTKRPLPYYIPFLFLKPNQLAFVLCLFILAILVSSTSSSFASLNSPTHHNEQKMFSRLSSFLDSHDSITPEMKENAVQEIIDFTNSFDITPNNEAKTIRHLFFAVQEKFLKEYVLYSSFFQTIDNGTYDCLTGSILYAVLLEEIKRKGNFDYTYEIVQNPIHVFVKIELSDKSEIIFESTSLKKGFIATRRGIEFYLREQADKVEEEIQKENTLFITNQKLNNLVTLEEASALLYFNQGVSFFNQRKFAKTLKMAKKAFVLQNNETFYNLIQLSSQKLQNSNSIAQNK